MRRDYHGFQIETYVDASLWRRKIFSLGCRLNIWPRRTYGEGNGHGWLLHAHVILGFWLFALSIEELKQPPTQRS